MTPATISVQEAARLLGISRGVAYAQANTGEIAGVPVIRVGGRLLIPRAPFERTLGITQDTTDEELEDT